MAFWGIEVKPGKPIVHSCENSRGRLRVSQATLGIGDANKKSIVQCNVGNRSPVLLCVLLPNQTESCHLDLEFEEADDVIFSAIGPRSVYLTGYYVSQRKKSNPHSDTIHQNAMKSFEGQLNFVNISPHLCRESYGVDIENTHSDGSSYCSDNDKYEDSFIDDDEIQVSTPSPVSSSKDIDETTPDKDKLKNGKGRLKKKFQIVESDDDSSPCESEDDDGYLLSVFMSKRAAKTTPTDAGDKIVHEAEIYDKSKNNCVPHQKSKEKVDPVDINDKPEREENPLLNGEMRQMKNGLLKEVDILDEITVNKKATISNDEVHGDKVEANINDQNLEKPKRKRKRKGKASSEEDKTCDVEIDKKPSVHREDKEHEVEASRNMEKGDDCNKSKKSRKEIQLDGESKEGIGTRFSDVVKDNKLEPDSLHADGVVKYQEHLTEDNVSIKSEFLANGDQPDKKVEKKKKKKKKKEQCDGDSNMALGNMKDNQETTSMKLENQTAKVESTQSRTLSNGLVIEELANGPTDGKVAAPGKKVKIYYTGMLKENGQIFDSNVGKAACRFRLGDEGVIDGWNIGIDGMHVGDKRRLIIPPSMGAGKNGARENTPPDSWLVYEVELASVHC